MKEKMKIIYMGTPDFAVPPLKALITAGHQILAVATQPDKQKGRGREVKYSPVKEYAIAQNLPVLQPLKIKTAAAVNELKKYDADIYIVAAYGQILSQEILNIPRYGCINIHASLLPKYRGAAPIQRSIMNGEQETGVTIMQMAMGIDTGDMLLAASIPIEAKETSDSLHDKLSVLGADLIIKALTKIEKGDLSATKQDNEASSLAPMLNRAESLIDWQMSALKIERLIRGLSSRPGAYTYYHEKTLKIWAADPIPARGEMAKPGTILEITKDSISVACGQDRLAITELQLEGKKKMPVRDFLLGYQMKTGEVLTSLSVKING